MGYCIGFAGKGGTGKTTVAGFLVRYLVENGKTPVLAVDADANTNLNEVLGLEVETTLSDAREEMKQKAPSLGMTKDIFIEMKINEALSEGKGFDLIAMGKPEGPGCYCAANALLTEFLQRLIRNYPYVVIDNEAGMEHISRLRAKDMDMLILVSDPTVRGIQAASRIAELAKKLNFGIKDYYLILNRVKETENQGTLLEEIKKANLNLAGTISEDVLVHEFDIEGKPLIQLPEDSVALKEAYRIFDKIIE
jgi:CO dehydrogenase maturation factor